MQGSPVKGLLSLCLAASMAEGTALPQSAPQSPAPSLEQGISEFNAGDFGAAVFTLEGAIRILAVEPASHGKELSQAYLYRGAAFVGLGQEENAKGSFAAALQYDKTLRPSPDQFPPRVLRVFEAARDGKTKSVLLPPSGAAKKAGLGTLGILGIVAAGVAIGGGAAAVAGRSGPDTTTATATTTVTTTSTTPTTVPPTPNPAPRTLTLAVGGGTLGGCSVAVNPGGHTCPAGNTCMYTYPSGTAVQFLPHAGLAELFTPGWSGDCSGQNPAQCMLTMDQDHSVGARFTP